MLPAILEPRHAVPTLDQESEEPPFGPAAFNNNGGVGDLFAVTRPGWLTRKAELWVAAVVEPPSARREYKR